MSPDGSTTGTMERVDAASAELRGARFRQPRVVGRRSQLSEPKSGSIHRMSAGAVYRERPLIAGEVCSALWTIGFAAATGDLAGRTPRSLLAQRATVEL